ncbi:microsomal signal peptidase 12 kDa subunit [Neocallimastix lanati (nom. inval.)]|uniref:Signal peptidase complex subunit 1 n=1 Tax=Neocallimastix californiae TaxID=1754190 RepID=A0A1Y1ZEL9_9FUNG|nr:microsomal signal peptidase 12 kDa subunit [Neocallimastix sp. JGI-2020a]ORY08624.1 microsomal signal peptidase 12 kDa subunit [Neocallimastix californiae]|eukprot:ORY08624.1 microsomal signal peptidase 12 kDa subunit [Neocallimastix californiae]
MVLIKDDIDFKGQQLTENLMQIILIAFGIVSFIVGFIMQSVKISCYIMLAGIIVTALVILPPWPFYSKNPIKFLPVKNADEKKEKKEK